MGCTNDKKTFSIYHFMLSYALKQLYMYGKNSMNTIDTATV